MYTFRNECHRFQLDGRLRENTFLNVLPSLLWVYACACVDSGHIILCLDAKKVFSPLYHCQKTRPLSGLFAVLVLALFLLLFVTPPHIRAAHLACLLAQLATQDMHNHCLNENFVSLKYNLL